MAKDKKALIAIISAILLIGIVAPVLIFRKGWLCSIDNRTLSYKNYIGKRVSVSSLANICYNSERNSFRVDNDPFEEYFNLLPLEGEIRDILMHQEFINGWNFDKSIDGGSCEHKNRYERFVEQAMENTWLYYAGQLNAGKQFKEYLVLSSSQELLWRDEERTLVGPHAHRYLYLITANILDNTIKSITLLAKYFIDRDVTVNMRARILSDKSFLLKTVVHCDSKSKASYNKFHFDEEGYVQPDD